MSLPSIQISARDHGALIMMIARLRARVAGLLISEIQRATVEAIVPIDVVGLGSSVTYRLDDGPEETRVLTFPENVNPWKLSVAAPLGAALLGLRQGAAFTFKAAGKDRTVRVVAVRPSPEAPATRKQARSNLLKRAWRVGRLRTRRASRAVRRIRPALGRTAAWTMSDSGLRLFCLVAVALMVVVLSFRYRLLAWINVE
jgi:transcription elongation GreA/GreB family factor